MTVRVKPRGVPCAHVHMHENVIRAVFVVSLALTAVPEFKIRVIEFRSATDCASMDRLPEIAAENIVAIRP